MLSTIFLKIYNYRFPVLRTPWLNGVGLTIIFCNSSALLNRYRQNPCKIAYGDGILPPESCSYGQRSKCADLGWTVTIFSPFWKKKRLKNHCCYDKLFTIWGNLGFFKNYNWEPWSIEERKEDRWKNESIFNTGRRHRLYRDQHRVEERNYQRNRL